MTKQTKKTTVKIQTSNGKVHTKKVSAPAKAPKLTLKAIIAQAQALIKSDSRKVARKFLRDNGHSIRDIKVFN